MTDSQSTDERAAVAERAARAGGERALDTFRAGIATEAKSGKTDLVTQADRDSQKRVSEVIAEIFPDEPIVGEEGEGEKEVPAEGPAWVIDPIDGTNNYVRGIRTWATSVAATVNGKPVAAANVMPALGDTYLAGEDRTTRNGEPVVVSDRTDPEAATVALTAWRGSDRPEAYTKLWGELTNRFGDLRRFGSAQITLSYVASGALDALFTNTQPNPWDTLAGVHLIRQAGGTVTDFEEEPWQGTGGFVASNGRERVHKTALEAAQVVRED